MKARNNHYVPQWYQRGFLEKASERLVYLNLRPDRIETPDSTLRYHHSLKKNCSTVSCFVEYDLYSTFLGDYVDDEIETKLFGKLDDTGATAIRAFIEGDAEKCYENFTNFFSYIDAQKLRTPKGLEWLNSHYPKLDQNRLMREMQALRNLNCTIWSEGVREIVSAKNSETKFIISDHPVTVYNYALSPDSPQNTYPYDPLIAQKASQTIFVLDRDNCLILTNLEYAENPDTNPIENRTHAKNFRDSLVRTDNFIRARAISETDVISINFILKRRARRYLASPNADWLFPERILEASWQELGKVLLPPKSELFHYGGEMYVGYKDGTSYYQDAFGRTHKDWDFIKKTPLSGDQRPRDECACGSGKQFQVCCSNKPKHLRPSSLELSIRERNLFFGNAIEKILLLDKGKSWDDVRKDLCDDQVKRIHEIFGYLWPVQTDIYSLLPKPDGVLRGLYTGIIDPRCINTFGVGMVPYFDEVILQNPFQHPEKLKPDYNPINSPHQFKQDTLKNVFLFFSMLPFIRAGFINLIPDVCIFDDYLHRQILDMAEPRLNRFSMHPAQKKILDFIKKDDFKRMFACLPKSYQRRQIIKIFPDKSEAEIEAIVNTISAAQKADPLSIIGNDLYEHGGQLAVMNMTPNFELSVLLAQLTGSVILTDSHYRWNELMTLTDLRFDKQTLWKNLVSSLDRSQIILHTDAKLNFQIREDTKLAGIRSVLRRMHSVVSSTNDIRVAEKKTPALIRDYTENLKKTNQYMMRQNDDNLSGFENISKNSIKAKLRWAIPDAGIFHDHVQRILLSSGVAHQNRKVQMAVFLEDFEEF